MDFEKQYWLNPLRSTSSGRSWRPLGRIFSRIRPAGVGFCTIISFQGMGGVTKIWDFPPSCPTIQPALPNSRLPKQNRADSGITKIMVNPNQARDHCIDSRVVKVTFEMELSSVPVPKNRWNCWNFSVHTVHFLLIKFLFRFQKVGGTATLIDIDSNIESSYRF